jgi:hypothetical protein
LYLQNIFKLHGLPDDIVSDRGPQFTSKFTTQLLQMLEVQGNKSTAFHPQSDGQTERVNQTLEQYLRIYCDYLQDDWSQLLPLAEFAYNDSNNASTQLTPFFANYGYHPRARAHLAVPANALSENPATTDFIQHVHDVHQLCRENLRLAQQRYKKAYDAGTREPPQFKPGDKVWLSRRNIKTIRPSPKLDVKRLGPFRVIEIVGESKLAYRLELPPSMRRIHPVFHVSLLEPYHANTISGRTQPEPPPIEVDGEEEWEVKEILDSRIVRGKLEYFVDWVGFDEGSRTWEPAKNCENSPELIATYHRKYPNRPSPNDIAKRSRRSIAN